MNNTVRILVVEDSLIAQKVITMHMTKQGCEVDVANDGKSALEKAMANQYDLILMDIGLGEGPDGFEVTKQIKAQSGLNQKTPVMAVTSHDEPHYQQEAAACDMVGYFNKPFTPHEAEIVLNALKELSK